MVPTLSAQVVVIGSGMGGGTTALALARRGVDVLVLERGQRVPREPANWSARGVRRAALPAAGQWRRRRGPCVLTGVHYVVGGNTKVYGASLPCVSRTSARSSIAKARRPAWPFALRGPRAPLRRGRAHLSRARHGGGGPHRAMAQHAVPVPRARARAPTSRSSPGACASRASGRTSNAMGVDRRPGGSCILYATCDGFVPARRQERRRDVRHRSRSRWARPPGDRRARAPDRRRRRRAARRPPRRRGGPRGAFEVTASASCWRPVP